MADSFSHCQPLHNAAPPLTCTVSTTHLSLSVETFSLPSCDPLVFNTSPFSFHSLETTKLWVSFFHKASISCNTRLQCAAACFVQVDDWIKTRCILREERNGRAHFIQAARKQSQRRHGTRREEEAVPLHGTSSSIEANKLALTLPCSSHVFQPHAWTSTTIRHSWLLEISRHNSLLIP